MWEPLTSGVTWRGPSLFVFHASEDTLRLALGSAPLPDFDANGLGAFDMWAIRFSCGLEVVIWLYQLGSLAAGQVDPHAPRPAELYANDRDLAHLRFHLPFELGEVSRWVPDRLVAHPADWQVWRQDDPGNNFLVSAHSSMCEAEAVAAAFEARGHKQLYYVLRRSSSAGR